MWSVFFVFLSYLDSNSVMGDFLSRALDAEKESEEMFSMFNDTFCAKMSTVRESFLYQVSDGAEAVRSFVNPAGALVNCSVIVNQMQVKSFLHECRLGLKEERVGRQFDTRYARLDEAKRMCRQFKEERSKRIGRVKGDASQDSALQDEVLRRTKRGFTYPGTLWCGAGNMADNYDQLGEFAETDSCCRIHDHCPHVIHAFSTNYGLTNYKWHSICHCDCDNVLKQCLRKVNDTSSRVMGQAFFNVIGAPCFEFAFEEQCAERHWYGKCKRYEKRPIAMLKDAVPYDFGGIEVIDELTVSPSKKQGSKNSKEEEKEEPASTTHPTMQGPEEPSLGQVVTAAEDFIKVIATVSTSQSSAHNSHTGGVQSSEKKKRKNNGKKKTTKKRKGKGRKRKLKAGVKVEEGAAVPTSAGKAEEAISLSNFISESHKRDKSSKNTNRVGGDSEYELGGEEEPQNEVMKDEPAMNKEPLSITSATTVHKQPAKSEALNGSTEETKSKNTTTVIPHRTKHRRLSKGKERMHKRIPPPSSEVLVTTTIDDLRAISAPTIIVINPTAHPEQQSDTEKQPSVTSTDGSPIVITKVKRNRPKERGDQQGRKRRIKFSSALPSVAVTHEKSSNDNVEGIHPSGLPVPSTEQQVSHRLDIYKGESSIEIMSPNLTFSVTKGQMSKEKGVRSRRRKAGTTLSRVNPLLGNSYENMLAVLSTPETSDALNHPATTAAISRVTEETGTLEEWRLFTTITASPPSYTKRNRQSTRQQRKPRKKSVPAALSNGVPVLKQTTMNFTTMEPSKVTPTEELHLQSFTSATPAMMSPIQLSFAKVKEQFIRKKRRKAALSLRQQ